MNNVNNITFEAKPLNKTTIQKYNKNKKSFVPATATFVKLEHENKFDLKAIAEAAKKWKDSKYIQKIATASSWMHQVPIEVYALTTQEKNFHKLNYKNILGFAEMRPDYNIENFNELYHIQVKPEARNIDKTLSKKKYMYVGCSILKSLKKIYNSISLYSAGGENLDKFYKKNNFINDYTCKTHYFWSSNPLTMIKIYFENLCNRLGI